MALDHMPEYLVTCSPHVTLGDSICRINEIRHELLGGDDEATLVVHAVAITTFRALHHVGQRRQFHFWSKEYAVQIFGADGLAGLAGEHDMFTLSDEVANSNILFCHF